MTRDVGWLLLLFLAFAAMFVALPFSFFWFVGWLVSGGMF